MILLGFKCRKSLKTFKKGFCAVVALDIYHVFEEEQKREK